MNEFLQTMICIQLTLQTDWVLSPEIRFLYGWGFIVTITIMIIINMYFVISSNLGTFKLICVKYCNLLDREIDNIGVSPPLSPRSTNVHFVNNALHERKKMFPGYEKPD